MLMKLGGVKGVTVDLLYLVELKTTRHIVPEKTNISYLSAGYIYLLRLREMGTTEERRIHVRVQISRR